MASASHSMAKLNRDNPVDSPFVGQTSHLHIFVLVGHYTKILSIQCIYNQSYMTMRPCQTFFFLCPKILPMLFLSRIEWIIMFSSLWILSGAFQAFIKPNWPRLISWGITFSNLWANNLDIIYSRQRAVKLDGKKHNQQYLYHSFIYWYYSCPHCFRKSSHLHKICNYGHKQAQFEARRSYKIQREIRLGLAIFQKGEII